MSLLSIHKVKCTCREVFRYREMTYLSGDGRSLVTRTEWKHLRRKSEFCNKCKKTKGVGRYTPLDEAHEVGAAEVQIECSEHPRNGALYKAVYHPETDWETGMVDGGHWSMVPFKETDEKATP